MTIDDMKNKISFELRSTDTQLGFEVICKKLADLEKTNEELKYNLKCREDELAESKSLVITLRHDLTNMTRRCEDHERATCAGCAYLPLDPSNEHCSRCYAGSERRYE